MCCKRRTAVQGAAAERSAVVRRVAEHDQQVQDLVQRSHGLLQGAGKEQPPGKCPAADTLQAYISGAI